MDPLIEQLSHRAGKALATRSWQLVTAESCTGGWIAEAITAIAGCSAWFDRGFVTYSNTAKRELLNVREATLKTHGAVSEQVVREMAQGALENSPADLAVAVSGIAGPTGGTPDKPVGTVCIGLAARAAAATAIRCHFDGDREAIRRQTVLFALEAVLLTAKGRTIAEALCHNRREPSKG